MNDVNKHDDDGLKNKTKMKTQANGLTVKHIYTYMRQGNTVAFYFMSSKI